MILTGVVAAMLMAAAAAGGEAAPSDARAARAGAQVRFEALWAQYLKAEDSANTDAATAAFAEIRRLRVERNIPSLDSIGLALVVRGLSHLDGGEADAAERDFRLAVGVAPTLPDAYLGLAAASLARGALGVPPALGHAFTGAVVRLPTAAGQLAAASIVAPSLAFAILAVAAVLGMGLGARYGRLLHHDIIEALGPGRSPSVGLALFVGLALLPVLTFQGWGWVPLWWTALLFAYTSRWERGVMIGVLVALAAMGPILRWLEMREAAGRNPLYWAAVSAVEGEGDRLAVAHLEAAAKGHPDDRDLGYLLGQQYRKLGLVDRAAGVYRGLLVADPNDLRAQINLANLEFCQGDFQPAVARYRSIAEVGPTEIAALAYYNLSLTHLQRFEYQPATEAKSEADRRSPGISERLASRWKDDRGDAAVVDFGLSKGQVHDKFLGAEDGPGRGNLAQSSAEGPSGLGLVAWLSRFSGFVGVFGAVAFGLEMWRGRKAFTVHCARCGLAFCRRCHLGAVVADLCSQCYHLYVIRDGVSGLARNQKLLEVQAEEARRVRLFRVMTVLSPGLGHIFAHRPIVGVALVGAWYLSAALAWMSWRVVTVTDAAAAVTRPYGALAALVAMVAIFAWAQRGRPTFAAGVPVRRVARRPRTL